MMLLLAFAGRVSLKLVVCLILSLSLIIGCYGLIVLLQARYMVRHQPREPMFECPKHGVFRKAHLLTLDFGNGVVHEQCPLCFHEKLKDTKLDGTV